ncbi:hypothetical protein DC522_26955 [Microvirga sp. KLBC 81]|nr:hypothetical protein DC522_26955 [Microvirga sp. KLBC 81]
MALASSLLKHHAVRSDSYTATDIAYKAERDRVATGCGTQDQIIVTLGGVRLLDFAAYKEYPRTITGAPEAMDYYVVVASPGGRTGYDDISGDLIRRSQINESRIAVYKDLNRSVPTKIFHALIDRDLTALKALSRFSTEAIRHLVNIDNDPVSKMIQTAEEHGSVYARPSGPRPQGGVMAALALDLSIAQSVAEALKPLSAFVAVDRLGKSGTEAFSC